MEAEILNNCFVIKMPQAVQLDLKPKYRHKKRLIFIDPGQLHRSAVHQSINLNELDVTSCPSFHLSLGRAILSFSL